MAENFYKKLRPASFRGIPFLLLRDGKTASRRIVVHEYPGKDTPYHEDLGAGPREFSLEAVISGPSFLSVASRFEAALSQSGPGALVLPHYGSLNVVALSWARQHASDQVGEVIFSITFQIYGKSLYPSSLKDTVTGLGLSSTQLFDSITSDFNTHFNLSGAQDFLVIDAASRTQTLLDQVTSALSNGGLASLARDLVPSSFSVAINLAGQIVSMFQNISSSTKPPLPSVVGTSKTSPTPVPVLSILDALSQSTRMRATVSGGSTKPRRLQNAQAIDLLFRGAGLAAAAGAARYAAYQSKEEAISFKTSLSNNIGLLRDDLGAAGYDQSWQSAGAVLAAISRDINERLGRLPRTIKVQSAAPRSSLSLANRLYGDNQAVIFSKARDISNRNKIRHPGFIPAAPLEILLDV